MILNQDSADSGTKTLTRPKQQLKKPSMYRVVLLNDDYTPMDFVVHILMKFFKKGETEATNIMLQVHQKGAGLCGVYPHEVAETKVFQVNEYARNNRHPLKCIMEEESN
ncbi:MAG: ATP-dependent Clp protease adapter ClpS [Bdellovibrionales bacterium]